MRKSYIRKILTAIGSVDMCVKVKGTLRRKSDLKLLVRIRQDTITTLILAGFIQMRDGAIVLTASGRHEMLGGDDAIIRRLKAVDDGNVTVPVNDALVAQGFVDWTGGCLTREGRLKIATKPEKRAVANINAGYPERVSDRMVAKIVKKGLYP